MSKRLSVLAAAVVVFWVGTNRSQAADRWPSDLNTRLTEAGTNRTEIVRALEQAPAAQRDGLAFLVRNMPDSDLRSLSAAFLLENLDLAYKAWEAAPWHRSVSKDLFFNDVLPYASLSEARHPWRKQLHDICQPLVAACKTPGEAAHVLNQKIFPLLKVRYNTARRRPDQSPRESMESGIATCTGLSILLVDACRAVAVPARVAGTPMWSNMRGNHTWVEVWDSDWHFAGAAEPDPAGLDHGWFVGDASKAQADVPRHAIYASSFRRSDLWFPLVWMPSDKSVPAVNVTARYAKSEAAKEVDKIELSVKVVDGEDKRVQALVSLIDPGNPASVLGDRSRGESADLNDFAKFTLVPGRKYKVAASLDKLKAETEVMPSREAHQLVTLKLKEHGASPDVAPTAKATVVESIPARQSARLKKQFEAYFAATPEKQKAWRFPSEFQKPIGKNEEGVRNVAWEAYKSAPIHAALKADYDERVVRNGPHVSPYTVKQVGTRPHHGWPLFIAMHGGGNAPKQVNDSQWKQMQGYYKEHPECGGYLYVALRAPNDTWNGFYDDYVYPLIDNLIRQFRIFCDVDQDKVFIMGYSHGGYGAYAIGPKMPDRFAAIHASAAAATDGETTANTLRTTPFTAMVGERDTMYGRYERNLKFRDQVAKLRGDRSDIYPVTVTVVQGNGHTGLPDRDKIVEMYSAVRNPVPTEITWLMTDKVVQDLFWLHVPEPAKQQEILASYSENRFVVTASAGISKARVYMDSRMVDFSKPVDVELDGSTTSHTFAPGVKMLCDTLLQRGDPGYAFTAAFDLVREGQNLKLVPVRD